jgi:hypothetical protein
LNSDGGITDQPRFASRFAVRGSTTDTTRLASTSLASSSTSSQAALTALKRPLQASPRPRSASAG